MKPFLLRHPINPDEVVLREVWPSLVRGVYTETGPEGFQRNWSSNRVGLWPGISFGWKYQGEGCREKQIFQKGVGGVGWYSLLKCIWDYMRQNLHFRVFRMCLFDAEHLMSTGVTY